jgi:hypothetical protein
VKRNIPFQRNKPLKRSPFKAKMPERKHREESFSGVDIDQVHFGRYGANDRHAPQPKTEPVRDEAYRRWVATLPCIRCGVHGRSQAAHPNFDKGMSQKTSDLDCFPLCAPTVNYMGCHSAHDLSFGMTREERRQRELDYIAAMKTMRELLDPFK